MGQDFLAFELENLLTSCSACCPPFSGAWDICSPSFDVVFDLSRVLFLWGGPPDFEEEASSFVFVDPLAGPRDLGASVLLVVVAVVEDDGFLAGGIVTASTGVRPVVEPSTPLEDLTAGTVFSFFLFAGLPLLRVPWEREQAIFDGSLHRLHAFP